MVGVPFFLLCHVGPSLSLIHIWHRNLGLTEAQKMILQIALTFGFMFGRHSRGLLTTQVQFLSLIHI